MLTSMLISALAPAAVEAVKALAGGFGRKFGALSVDDEIKLKSADIERLKALANLDDPRGTPSQWVVDLRGSFRYIACTIMVVGGVGTLFVAPALAPIGLEVAACASSFIFGERMMLTLRK